MKPIQVSDWSQKYKLVIYGISGIIILLIGNKIIYLLEEILISVNKLVK